MANINTFISVLKKSSGFLFGNRYKVTMSKLNDESLSYFCSKVDLPSIDYVQVDLDIGGKLIHIPNKMSLGDLNLTFYNTGSELKRIHSFCDSNVYAKSTHAVGYYDDIAMDITVNEYNNANSIILTRTYQDCIIKSISPISLTYAEATEVQQFTIGFSCGSVTVS